MGLSVAARITGEVDKLELAEEAAKTLLSLPVDLPFLTSLGRASLALLAVERGNTRAAKELYDALKSVPSHMLAYISTDRVLGLLSTTLDRLERAAVHFEDALAFCRRTGYRPELAWTCCDYADALLQRRNSGDLEKAKPLLDEAQTIAVELGMHPLVERVQERLDLLASIGMGAPDYPDGLSRREVEVLRQLAFGKSNREIGDELVITEGTVRRHVSNVYQKIGASNRSEATSYALREGLVSFE